LLRVVVAGHQRDRAASSRVSTNDRGEDVEQVGGHRDDAFAVSFRWGDDEKGDDLPVGSLVLTDAELGQLQQLLDADSGVPEGLDDGPFPERVLLRPQQIDNLATRLDLD